MGFKKFSLLIVLRTLLAMVSLILLALVIIAPGYHATSLFLALLVIFQFSEMLRFVSKTNAGLVRFLDAARYADFSQRFDFSELGSGFEELGDAFNEILTRLHKVRSTQEEELKRMKTVIEHVPVPLISLFHDDQIRLWNNSARRLFGTHTINRTDDLIQFGANFPGLLKTVPVGKRVLINTEIDGVEHRLSVAATQIITAQKKETLLSLQDIQSELDIAQLQAWQALVSVLTHEIMNSITPVASLAKTALDIMQDIVGDVKDKTQASPELSEDLDDVLEAIQTVARRSEGLMTFVTSYRRLTRLPEPNKKNIKICELFKQVQRLATLNWPEKKIRLTTKITPAALDLSVDIDMVEQLLINLLQNAEQALVNVTNPEVSMTASLNLRGRVVIDVSDNGSGIAEELSAQIFVPFFTTKTQGSGVGLALARQIMIAHGGNISLRNINTGDNKNNSSSGASFSLTF